MRWWRVVYAPGLVRALWFERLITLTLNVFDNITLEQGGHQPKISGGPRSRYKVEKRWSTLKRWSIRGEKMVAPRGHRWSQTGTAVSDGHPALENTRGAKHFKVCVAFVDLVTSQADSQVCHARRVRMGTNTSSLCTPPRTARYSNHRNLTTTEWGVSSINGFPLARWIVGTILFAG